MHPSVRPHSISPCIWATLRTNIPINCQNLSKLFTAMISYPGTSHSIWNEIIKVSWKKFILRVRIITYLIKHLTVNCILLITINVMNWKMQVTIKLWYKSWHTYYLLKINIQAYIRSSVQLEKYYFITFSLSLSLSLAHTHTHKTHTRVRIHILPSMILILTRWVSSLFSYFFIDSEFACSPNKNTPTLIRDTFHLPSLNETRVIACLVTHTRTFRNMITFWQKQYVLLPSAGNSSVVIPTNVCMISGE